MNEETLRQGQARDGQGSTATGRKISEIVAYQRVADMPSSKELIIQVRRRRTAFVQGRPPHLGVVLHEMVFSATRCL